MFAVSALSWLWPSFMQWCVLAASCTSLADQVPTAHRQGHDHVNQLPWTCTLVVLLQNQIKSEEQFQAKKAELRAAALERLENIFEEKGKVSRAGRAGLT